MRTEDHLLLEGGGGAGDLVGGHAGSPVRRGGRTVMIAHLLNLLRQREPRPKYEGRHRAETPRQRTGGPDSAESFVSLKSLMKAS